MSLLADISARLAACTADELEMIDRNLLVIERARDHAAHVLEWEHEDVRVTRRRAATEQPYDEIAIGEAT